MPIEGQFRVNKRMNPRMNQRHATQLFSLCLVLLALSAGFSRALAEDWPTYMRDIRRSGVTAEEAVFPLHAQWVYTPHLAPRPAWPEPAKQDIWHKIREISPAVIYDRAYHAVSVGDAVYFAASADDQVYCLDAASGETRWTFFTEGPVRLAPTVVEGRVYFSSDDGYAYCISADAGKLIWKYSPASMDRRIPGNGRVISYAPARTGVLVDGGTAYFMAGLFAPDQVYQCALDAVTGEVRLQSAPAELSPQGYLLASSTRLFAPTGRTAPIMFDRATLESAGAVQGPGGAYALLVEDALVSGPGRRDGSLDYADAQTRETVASFPGVRMLVKDGIAYLQSSSEASALDRPRYLQLSAEMNRRNAAVGDLRTRVREMGPDAKEELARLGTEIAAIEAELAALDAQRAECTLWKRPATDPFSMILAGDALFLGGQDAVLALNAADGAERWRHDVEGRVYGLAFANGKLFASTSAGNVYCFAATSMAAPRIVAPEVAEQPFAENELGKICANAAAFILKDSGVNRGYCLVLGAGDGRLALELAKRSDLHILVVEREEVAAAALRQAFSRAGLYGARIAVHHINAGQLPYSSYFANLIVSEEALLKGALDWEANELFRVLRPYGGKAYIGQSKKAANGAVALSQAELEAWLGNGPAKEGARIGQRNGLWALLERGAVSGAGEWTQLYADASHTACSLDEVRGPMAVQWFGEPGPRDMVDRHHRPMSALFKDGRLFITADNKMIAVDGYNGFPLWELEIPDSRRVGAMKNSGHQMIIDDALYLVRADECWVVNAADGVKKKTFSAPAMEGEEEDWGYLNGDSDIIVGTKQAKGASFERMHLATVNMLEGDFRPVVISNAVFALDRKTGRELWNRRQGRILNAMIAMAEGRLYLVESRNEEAMANDNGRLRVDVFLKQDASLVALDLKTGAVAWERPVALNFAHIAFLNGRNGVLLATGSYNKGDGLYYDLVAFDMADGKDKWQASFRGMNVRCTDYSELEGSHGEQWQHPVISNDVVYARPFAFDLHTGAQKDYIAYRGGHGCGGLTGSAHYLFGRGSVPRMYPTDVASTEGIPLSEVSRPGCWLNIIPAGGIVMIPESSSGCTCAYPLQTSIAFAPLSVAGGVERNRI